MLNIKVETNFNDPKDIPMNMPCPNPKKKCSGKLTFKLSDIGAGKKVRCETCGVNFKLNDKKEV